MSPAPAAGTPADIHTYTGGCLCQAVRFRATGPLLAAATCHCRECQYLSGGAPAHALLLPAGALRLEQGAPRSTITAARRGRRVMRSFCADCGTPLFGHTEDAGYTVVRAGALDEPERFANQLTVWTASAPPWHAIDTAHPHFAGNAPS